MPDRKWPQRLSEPQRIVSSKPPPETNLARGASTRCVIWWRVNQLPELALNQRRKLPNNRFQRTSLRAATEPERSPDSDGSEPREGRCCLASQRCHGKPRSRGAANRPVHQARGQDRSLRARGWGHESDGSGSWSFRVGHAGLCPADPVRRVTTRTWARAGIARWHVGGQTLGRDGRPSNLAPHQTTSPARLDGRIASWQGQHRSSSTRR